MATYKLIGVVAGRFKSIPAGDSAKIGRLTLDLSGVSTSRTLTAPDKSGTIATTDDIPASLTLGLALALSKNTPFV